jgi:hypothetical protein
MAAQARVEASRAAKIYQTNKVSHATVLLGLRLAMGRALRSLIVEVHKVFASQARRGERRIIR